MTRETDNLYHDMLNSGELYDSVDDQFIAYQQITEDDDRFEGGKPIPQELIDKYM